ncbi:MAG: tRNA pseudouridine(38-40) synthase TruA [Verrucomicrobiae bacterium]|nr:tRNA pseudouridine(38-40) synthase TruA [Verrucomicrobiae bacterium]
MSAKNSAPPNKPVSKPAANAARTLKFKLTIAYDGAAYQGWQAQRVGTGVQELVEAGLAKLFPSRPRLIGSSRTDTGVHALGLVAHFSLPRAEFRMPVRRLALAINATLPADIRVMRAGRAVDNFQARFDATGKQYRYRVWNSPTMNPLLRAYAWHVPQPLDLSAMRAAAKRLVGRHDFRSFTANRGVPLADAVRTLRRCDIKRSGAQLTFVIEGDGFLYKMCRGIVGTLVQIGYGRFPASEIKTMLARKSRDAAGMNAPACGLVLWRVFYRPRQSRSRPTQD